MKSELTFIIFMMFLIATAVLFLWLMTRISSARTVVSSPSEKSPSAWATALASSTTISSGSQPAKAGSRNKIIRRKQLKS